SSSRACSAVISPRRCFREIRLGPFASWPAQTRRVKFSISSLTSLSAWANSFRASRIALCSFSSSKVGESWQYFVPNSRREIHRHTIRFFPFLAQVHRL
ncbi:50S ribosomal protein L23, partial [Dysosmobacter welbionis]